MRLFIAMLALCGTCLAADRPMILVTPAGVYQSIVTDGVPGPWRSMDADVIVQGFGGGGGTNPVPPVGDPAPPTDSVTQQIAALSKSLGGGDAGKGKLEATAIAAIIDSLKDAGLSGTALIDALNLSAPLADASLKSDGRIVAWFKAATKVTADPEKLTNGVRSAWNVAAATVETVRTAAAQPAGTELTGEAVDFSQIIAILTMVLELLKKLGII